MSRIGNRCGLRKVIERWPRSVQNEAPTGGNCGGRSSDGASETSSGNPYQQVHGADEASNGLSASPVYASLELSVVAGGGSSVNFAKNVLSLPIRRELPSTCCA